VWRPVGKSVSPHSEIRRLNTSEISYSHSAECDDSSLLSRAVTYDREKHIDLSENSPT
jgi:hypothetical protein